MNYLKEKINSLFEKLLNKRFKKLVKVGLYARDVDAVKLENEKRARLVLLCSCKDQVYAVICTNTHKVNTISYFELLGHYITAQKAVISNKRIELHGRYEGYQAQLIVAQNVTVKLSAKKQ